MILEEDDFVKPVEYSRLQCYCQFYNEIKNFMKNRLRLTNSYQGVALK